MDERKMEGGRQAWREDRWGGKRIRETERERVRGTEFEVYFQDYSVRDMKIADLSCTIDKNEVVSTTTVIVPL